MPPVVVILSGDMEILEGRERETLKEIPALGTVTSRWLVRGGKGKRITVEATAPSAGAAKKSFILDGNGGQR